MRRYLLISGTLFALLVVAHLARLGIEGAVVLRDPAITPPGPPTEALFDSRAGGS